MKTQDKKSLKLRKKADRGKLRVKERLDKPLDILIIDCWALEMKSVIEGFSPRLVISGHENEMGHTIDHREAFWLTQYKLDTMSLPIPSVILCWGEGYRY